jgi:hypothetical protein
MEYLQNPMVMILGLLALTFSLMALQRRYRSELWLIVLMIFIFALPRAGVLVPGINLPLPIAHVLAAVLILEWLLFRRKRFPEPTSLNLYFLLYTAVAGLGLVIGLATGGVHRIMFLELCFYLFAIGLFFYASETFLQRRHFHVFGKLLLVISLGISTYGIAQRYFGSGILINNITYNAAHDVARSYVELPGAQMRVLSSYGDPNVLSSQLLVFTGMALALLLAKGVSARIRMLCIAVVTLNVICIFYTGSRAGMLLLPLVAIIICVWRTRWALFILPVLVFIGILFLPQWFATSRFAGGIGSEDVRHQFPQMAWRLLQVVPMGCGWGKTVLLQIQGMSWAFEVKPAHVVWMGFNSFWLTLFCRLGVPGVVTFIMLLAALFKYVWTRAKLINDPLVKAMLIGILAGFVGQWAIWMVNNTYMLPGGNLNFWFTMGMLVAGCRAYAPQPYPALLPVEPSLPTGQVATI